MSAESTARLLLSAALICLPSRGEAQVLPAGPLRLFDGKVSVSGEVVATAGEQDDETFFNYTDYEHNALRLFRASLAGLWQPSDRLAFVAELRSEDLENVTPFAAYVRVRPWPSYRLDIQAGRIPPTFGTFGRRAYGFENPVIGYPLAYQYLTSLRPDAVPVTADDLLRMRARGWRASYPVGSPVPAPGVPLVSGFRWDTGVQVRWGAGPFEASGAITSGTLSNPRVDDDNGGKQLSGRVSLSPVVGLVIGASAARGAWLADTLAASGDRPQTGFGLDAEYSRGYWVVRGEAIWSRWALPYPRATSNGRDLRAWAAYTEARYRITPRIFAAIRGDRLRFSSIAGPRGTGRVPWDAPVDRVELSAGYYLQRNVIARASVQSNWRDLGRRRRRTFVSAQIGWWF